MLLELGKTYGKSNNMNLSVIVTSRKDRIQQMECNMFRFQYGEGLV